MMSFVCSSVNATTLHFQQSSKQALVKQDLENVYLFDQSKQLMGISDSEGLIKNIDCISRCELIALHNDFENKIIPINSKQQNINIQLVAKESTEDTDDVKKQSLTSDNEVKVIGTRAPNHFADLNTANSYVQPEQLIVQPASILDFLTEIPGVAENGQAGLFQVYSIRGLSRQRVLTYLSDIPIKAERRAGVATSFLHPYLLAGAEVKRGPASTLYQSGSLGGVIKLQPRFFEQNYFRADYGSAGDRNSQVFATGMEDWSLAFARQSSKRAEDVKGNLLNDGYDQYSASFIKQWHKSGLDIQWTTLVSQGNDIGRSSTQFPSRLVVVPDEQHILSELGMQAENWRFSLYTHLNQVETETIRPQNRTNLVTNESNDFGFHFDRNWESSNYEGLWGIDGFAREKINAKDLQTNFSDGSTGQILSLRDASENEAAIFATVNSYVGTFKWQLGARLINSNQTNKGFNSVNDSTVTGFFGVSKQVNSSWLLTANLGTGVRFPTVSERFFSGTTGRGAVEGNPDLEKERSLSFDLGAQYRIASMRLSANFYRQKINNYIERVEVATDLLSFRNLQDGTIQGWELESAFTINPKWDLGVNVTHVKGYDQNSNALADIPANRVKFKNTHQLNKFNLSYAAEYRQHKDFFAGNEKETPAVWIGEASLSYQFNDQIKMSLSVDNLFDESYFNSSDELVPFALGRNWVATLSSQW